MELLEHQHVTASGRSLHCDSVQVDNILRLTLVVVVVTILGR